MPPRVFKIWAHDEPRPAIGCVSNFPHASVPPNWFADEDPQHAAELYGLERGEGEYTVTIEYDDGTSYVVKMEVERQLTASVRECTETTPDTSHQLGLYG